MMQFFWIFPLIHHPHGAAFCLLQRKGIDPCVSFGLKDQIGLEKGLIDGGDVDFVKSSLPVSDELEGNLRPRAGRALAIGGRGFTVRAEAHNTFCLAALKCGVQQDLLARTP